MHYQCLIVDDEVSLGEATAQYFNLFEVKTYYVDTAKKCLDFLQEHTVDVILLDINLEESSGFELCKKIREHCLVPILFISARTSDDDVIIALNIGGDDYIKKPYSLSVLLAKVKVVLKRYGMDKESKRQEDVFSCGTLRIEYHTGKVYKNEKEIALKGMEYRLLVYLTKHRGRIISKNELFQNVWEDSITGDGTLNVHIRHLREKIEDDPNDPEMIKTIWGRGYQFEEQVYE
ncbi:DNA-binding response regulator [Lachnospiraceae bacterium KM106-2]|nr:DNA-binding response regulator [Lachnospiraceae bacterium KM106-2]